jgi:GT2 family glycosyltransferase
VKVGALSRSIVVVCHSNQPSLGRCLESALEEADEVVLVDNGSPGEAASAVGRRLGAAVVRLPANVGFPAGVNRGLERAGGDLVALLNDDAWCDPGWLDSAEKVLADPTVAAVGPKVLFARPHAEIRLDEEPHFAPGDPRPLGRCIRRVTAGGAEVPLASLFGEGLHGLEEGVGPDGEPGQWRWSTGQGAIHVPMPDLDGGEVNIDGEPVPVVTLVHRLNNAGSYLSTHGHGGDYGFLADPAAPGGPFDQPGERFAATGAAMVARAETFRRLGGLAESFFAYYEDTDWCWRARLAGLSIRYEPAGVVHHVGGASTGGPFSARVQFLAARNRIHTLARNAPLPVVWSELRSPVDRPASGMALPLVRSLTRGMVDRRGLARLWKATPEEIWSAWAGRDEHW